MARVTGSVPPTPARRVLAAVPRTNPVDRPFEGELVPAAILASDFGPHNWVLLLCLFVAGMVLIMGTAVRVTVAV